MNKATGVDGLGTVSEIADMVSGEVLGSSEGPVIRVDIDSRTCTVGTLFVALPGTRTDGHRFVADAVEKGAVASLVAREQSASLDLEGLRSRAALILVDDPLAALQELAAQHRRRLPGMTWVGITGSNGKTTTKELLASILSAGYGEDAVCWSRGNYNSEIGLPLSVLSVEPYHRVAVLEMGMNQPGEMAELARIALPTRAIITNIGDAHIGNVGSRDGIAREKREIFSRLTEDDVAFVREDEPYRDFLVEQTRARAVLYGPESTDGYQGARLSGDGWLLSWRGREIPLALPGWHNVLNALAAVSLCSELGVGDEAVARGLAAVRPVSGRMERIDGAVTILNDSYNANSASMRAAFETFAELPSEGRKIAVIGEMAELGDYSADTHTTVARDAASRGFDLVLAVGQEYRRALAETPSSLRFPETVDEAGRLLRDLLRPGDTVLLKGSRAAGMEQLIPVIRDLEKE